MNNGRNETLNDDLFFHIHSSFTVLSNKHQLVSSDLVLEFALYSKQTYIHLD